MERIVFYLIAVVMIVFAIKAVTSRKMLRAVIYLLFVLMGVAGLYFMVDYTFMAAIQLAVYAGGVIVLIIFSVLLVHHIELRLEVSKMSQRIMAALLSLAGFTVTVYALFTYDFKVAENYKPIEVSDIGHGMLSYKAGGFILPFEVISVLLVAVMIGAIVIAKGKRLEQ
ncbi:NADH-quinone oxidoreductase subunit J family protein [Lutimonas sp.]|uniref:NADH-quinone oxidoreductase subunit J family protein n=1 Tax=Lutimonas sp. TaxID=1872403 RepID=UPI003D9AB606